MPSDTCLRLETLAFCLERPRFVPWSRICGTWRVADPRGSKDAYEYVPPQSGERSTDFYGAPLFICTRHGLQKARSISMLLLRDVRRCRGINISSRWRWWASMLMVIKSNCRRGHRMWLVKFFETARKSCVAVAFEVWVKGFILRWR